MERIRSHLPPSASSHSSPTHSVSLDRKQHTFPMEIYERSGMQYEVPRTSRDNRDDERDDPALKMRREERYQWQRHDLINPPVSTPKDSPIIRLPIVTHHHSANRRPSDMVSWRRGNTTWYNSTGQERIGARFGHVNVGGRIQPVGMVPLAQEEASTAKQHRAKTYSQYTLTSTPTTSRNGSSDHTSLWSHRYQPPPTLSHRQRTSSSRGRGNHQSVSPPLLSSRVIIPSNIVIPSALSPQSSSGTESPVETPEDSQGKRSTTDSWKSSPSPTPSLKRQKTNFGSQDTGFDKLDLLCAATLDLGPLSENPAGCSCPKSKCVALYCDCFKAGRRCSPTACTCLNCKNTVEESGANGARSKAIHAILARNPRAFTNAGNGNPANKLKPGEQACNCIRSQCLKLYCTCFQGGKVCNPEICTCVGCLNTAEDFGGKRKMAISATLEKRPDAFNVKKEKEIGAGCACKNNRCIRKYCECFRTNLACTSACSCRDCQNQGVRL